MRNIYFINIISLNIKTYQLVNDKTEIMPSPPANPNLLEKFP